MQRTAGTGGAGASQDPPLLRMSDGPGLDTETLPPGEPDPYACLPPRAERSTSTLALTPPDWAFQVTGCDRQAVSDAFLVDPDLRDMDKFDDKVERLQRIMKAKRELAKLCHEIAMTTAKRKVGGQNKEQIVTPLPLDAFVAAMISKVRYFIVFCSLSLVADLPL